MKPSTSSATRIKQEHGSDKVLVGDEADVTGNTGKEKPRASQAKEHSKATEPESKSSSSNSRSDDKKTSSEKSTKSSTVNGPSKSDHTSKRVSDTGAAESQGMVLKNVHHSIMYWSISTAVLPLITY